MKVTYYLQDLHSFYAKDGQKLRQLKPFVPKMLEDGAFQHFKSGTITMGQFVLSLKIALML